MESSTKKKILIIHNNQDSFEELIDKLTQYPFEVFKASEGNSGFNLAKQEKPDLILATAQLPDMDGFDLCWLIRQTYELLPIPYILLTDEMNPEERINAYRSGVDAFLNSNTSIRELYTVIETIIKRIHQIKNSLTQLHYSIQGKIHHFSVIEILQMLNMSKKNGTITFIQKDMQGKIGIWDGKLTWAEVENSYGEEAVKKMAFWKEGSFVFEKDLIHPHKNINTPTMQLILDCCQLLDENNE